MSRLAPTELEKCGLPAVGEPFNPAEFRNAVDISVEMLRAERFTPLEKLVWGRVTLLCMFGPNTNRNGWALDLGGLASDLGVDRGAVLRALRRLQRMGALDVRT